MKTMERSYGRFAMEPKVDSQLNSTHDLFDGKLSGQQLGSISDVAG